MISIWAEGKPVRVFVGCMAILLSGTTGSFAEDTVKIGTILSNSGSYVNQIVSVAGTVRSPRLEQYKSNITGTIKCNQYFTLADETGSIPVISFSQCAIGGQEAIILVNGDRVLVEANVEAPGSDTSVLGGKAMPLHLNVRRLSRSGK